MRLRLAPCACTMGLRPLYHAQGALQAWPYAMRHGPCAHGRMSALAHAHVPMRSALGYRAKKLAIIC